MMNEKEYCLYSDELERMGGAKVGGNEPEEGHNWYFAEVSICYFMRP